MYIYIYIHTYTFTYIHKHIYIHIHIHIYINIYIYSHHHYMGSLLRPLSFPGRPSSRRGWCSAPLYLFIYLYTYTCTYMSFFRRKAKFPPGVVQRIAISIYLSIYIYIYIYVFLSQEIQVPAGGGTALRGGMAWLPSPVRLLDGADDYADRIPIRRTEVRRPTC